jgi:hypothetical protein
MWKSKSFSLRANFFIPEIEEWYIFNKISRDIYGSGNEQLLLDCNLFSVYDPQARSE